MIQELTNYHNLSEYYLNQLYVIVMNLELRKQI